MFFKKYGTSHRLLFYQKGFAVVLGSIDFYLIEVLSRRQVHFLLGQQSKVVLTGFDSGVDGFANFSSQNIEDIDLHIGVFVYGEV